MAVTNGHYTASHNRFSATLKCLFKMSSDGRNLNMTANGKYRATINHQVAKDLNVMEYLQGETYHCSYNIACFCFMADDCLVRSF